MKNIYKILLSVILICGCLTARAQNRQITGVIKDNEGPVPNVNVFEKGIPTNGTSANIDGKFKITLRGTSNILVFHAVGYISQEVNVRGKENIEVTIKDDTKGLEEVVVVGYGTQKKVNVIGAVSAIGHTELMQTPSSSIQNTLIGKLPGFFSQQRSGQPGGDGATFFIRGVSTPSGNQSPLILVDDVVYNYDDFSRIDPNEVESVSILKDAATTAPYGIEGANGVVLVTTRRGKIGAPHINVRSEFGVQAPTQIPQFLDSYNTAVLVNGAQRNDAIIAGTLSSFVPQFSAADLQKFKDGSDPYGHPNINWYNTLFKKVAPTSTTNADISGGTDRVQYFVSMGFLDQGGLLRDFNAPGDPASSAAVDNNSEYNRFNFRSNLDIKATNSLTFHVDLSGNTSETNSPSIGAASAFYAIYNYGTLTPFVYPIYNPNGTYGFTNPNFVAPGGNNIIGRLAYGGYNRALANLININASAVQNLDKLTKGLMFKINLSASNSESSTSTLTRTNFPSYFYNSDNNTYTARDATIYRVDPWASTYSSGTPRRQTSITASMNYARSFGKNNFGGLLLANQSSILIPDIVSGTEQADSYIPTNLRGITSRETYNYADKYMAEFDGSYNGTDKFAANKKYGFFPAGSVGWNMAEENFVKNNLKFIDAFKLRVSYGIVGSDNLPNGAKNSYQENYIRGGGYSFGETNTPYTSITPSTLSNTNVTWEKESKFDAGVDFSLFNGRLSGVVDVFRNQRYNILTTLNTVPTYYGVPSAGLPPENIGIVDNNGFEVELNYNGKIGKLGYNFKGTFSYAKNKIIQEDEVPPLYPWQRQTGHSIGTNPEWIWDGFYSVAEAADPKVPKYIGSTVAGVPGTTLPGFLKYRDINGDGVISALDQGYFGKSNLPTTVVGFNMGLNYKHFSLNVLMQASLDYTIQMNYDFATPFKANLQDIELSTWTPATAATAKFPALVSNFHGTYMTAGNYSTFWSIPGDYLRVKSVELAYQLPEKWATGVGVKGIRVYANAYNLYTWSASFKKYGTDPETTPGAGESGAAGTYPQETLINLGVNVSIK
jgi:TonB-linked SusC/RagA family outer membrane protein